MVGEHWAVLYLNKFNDPSNIQVAWKCVRKGFRANGLVSWLCMGELISLKVGLKEKSLLCVFGCDLMTMRPFMVIITGGHH